jgi:CubicO group peptidase (beta-lactamase class C family)
VVERITGEALPDYARHRIFEPLGMRDTTFRADATPIGAVPLDPARPAPLSIGDGGMWSTTTDLLTWCDALNTDRLGGTALLETPGRLDDGTEIDYAWGMGVREHRGTRVYRHGGSWADVRAMLVRVPDQGLGLVVLAAADQSERRTALTDALLDRLLPG